MSTLESLIVALEGAPEGSRELDRLIGREHRYPDWRSRVGKEEVPTGAQGLVRDSVEADYLHDQAAHYTTSLDAALEGENIVYAQTVREGQWTAMHKPPEGVCFTAIAATEPLARRAAALKARSAP